MPKHLFPGVAPFVEAANDAYQLHPSQVGQACALSAVSRAQNALANVVEGPDDEAHRAACLAEATRWRDVLLLAAEGIDRAVESVRAAYATPTPSEV